MTTVSSNTTPTNFIAAPNPPTPPDPAVLLGLQGPAAGPQHTALEISTNPINVYPRTMDRIASAFAEEVYKLTNASHLVKLAKVMLGDSGIGQLRKRLMLSRLQSTTQGAHFYDLDSFYGSIFNVTRQTTELLPVNPYTDVADADTWSIVRSKDSSYRTRIDQFGKAVALGASAIGMELISEAILQVTCSVYESWVQDDAALGTVNRKIFTIVPHRVISLEEAFDLQVVLDVIKPADAVLNITTAGFETDIPVTLRGAASDSEYWELVESVIPNPVYAQYYSLSSTVQPGGFRELLRPVFSEYQGEQIFYNADITGVTAYDLNALGNTITNTVVGSFTFQDGVTLYYPPNQGIASRFYTSSGRSVSDGILQGALYSGQSANVNNTTGQLDLYVDGMPIENLLSIIGSGGQVSQLGVEDPSQRFWLTPTRLSTDQTQEVIEVRLVANRLVNFISFSAAHFPQTIQVQIFNDANSTWTTVSTNAVSDSIPNLLAQVVPSQHINPQHTGNGAWIDYEIDIPATSLDRVRIVLTRLASGTPPYLDVITTAPGGHIQTPTKTPIPYSLGIQNMLVGYQVEQKSDLPLQPIVTTDAVGSQVQYNVRSELANNAINGGDIPWRSEPQPSNDSVVNFYLDTRTDDGNAQIVDKIFMDPLFIGPHCTVYTSSDDTADLGFQADTTPLVAPAAVGHGTLTPVFNGMQFDIQNASYVDIQNLDIQFDPTQAWWCAVALAPNFSSNHASGETLWDFGNGLTLKLENTSVVLTAGSGSTTVSNYIYTPGQVLYITVAYFPENTTDFSQGMYLMVGNNTPINQEAQNTKGNGLMLPPLHPIFDSSNTPSDFFAGFQPGSLGAIQPTLRFGGTLSSPAPANFTLLAVVLKQAPLTNEDANGFNQNYTAYTLRSPFVDADALTVNAILRFDVAFIEGEDVTGFVGGPGNFWKLLNWTPISRDYVLQKGYLQLPPVNSKYLKFEFTNLVAQQYNSFIPIIKDVITQTGLSNTLVQKTVVPTQNNPGSGPNGTTNQVLLSVFSGLFYSDSQALRTNFFSSTPAALQPTMAQSATDLTTRQNLAASSWIWQFQKWAIDPNAPRFVTTGVHTYNTTSIAQSNNTAYFVGLNALEAYRIDYTEDDDTPFYDDFFYDDLNISSTDIPRDPGDLNTTGVTSLPVTAQSVTFNSTTPISAIQFATQQNDAIEIAEDDNFRSGALIAPYDWSNVNIAHQIGDAALTYQPDTFSVLVTRNDLGSDAGGTQSPPEGLVDTIVHPVYDESTAAVVPSGSPSADFSSEIGVAGAELGMVPPGWLGNAQFQNKGGLANGIATTGTVGAVWGAVRVTTNVVLAQPLTLEIVDSDSGTIVASLPFNCAPGQTTEQYIGYELGSVVSAGGPIYTRVVQYGQTNDTWIVDRLSTFEEGWLWQFSNDGGSNWHSAFDIRNNDFGILTFPAPGTEFAWKVTATREALHCSALRIRPVYSGILADYPQGVMKGPNQSVYDHQPPITEDPMFTGWNKPIPSWWFLANQQYVQLAPSGGPVINPNAQSFDRTASDSLPGFSDSATRQIFVGRITEESAIVTDKVSRGVTFKKGTSESLHISEHTVGTRVHIPGREDMVENPMWPIGKQSWPIKNVNAGVGNVTATGKNITGALVPGSAHVTVSAGQPKKTVIPGTANVAVTGYPA